MEISKNDRKSQTMGAHCKHGVNWSAACAHIPHKKECFRYSLPVQLFIFVVLAGGKSSFPIEVNH